jgi:type VI protein secretion system component Hcp
MIVLNVGDLAVKGDCTIKGYEGWIILEDASFSVARQGAEIDAGGKGHRRMGETVLSDVSAVKETDMASGEIFGLACAGDAKLDTAVIRWLEEGGASGNEAKGVKLELKLEEPIVTSYNVAGDRPGMENFTISYTKITVQPFKFDGVSWSKLSPKVYNALTSTLE